MSIRMELLKLDLLFHVEMRSTTTSTEPSSVDVLRTRIGTVVYGNFGSFPIERIISRKSWKSSGQRSTMAKRLYFIAALEFIVLLFASVR